MSRTIRNKGQYLFEIEQLNNYLHYLEKPNKKYYNTRAKRETYVEFTIQTRIDHEKHIEQLKKERHRDGFPVTCRWKRYIEKNVRNHHKMAITKSLRTDSDYTYDENGLNKARRAMAANCD